MRLKSNVALYLESGPVIEAVSDEIAPGFCSRRCAGGNFQNVPWQSNTNVPSFVMINVLEFNSHECLQVPDCLLARVEQKQF
jgi:hypothetical protein